MRRVLGANHRKPKPEVAAVATECSETAEQATAPVDVADASPQINAIEEIAVSEVEDTSNGVENEEDFFGEAVCAECESGGLLDCCDGCARSWHAESLYQVTFIDIGPQVILRPRILWEANKYYRSLALRR
jgi:hypothetical protein